MNQIVGTKENENEVLQYACLNGHVVTATGPDGQSLDLAGHFCPLCLGKVVDAEDDHTWILSPRQIEGVLRK